MSKKPKWLELPRGPVGRNTLWNLAGQAVPLLVALLAMPPVVRQLGNQRFGVLALIWAVLGYFSLFDLGLGRATTKYVAQLLDRDPGATGPVITGALLVQVGMGVAGAVILTVLTPALTHLLVPDAVAPETRTA